MGNARCYPGGTGLGRVFVDQTQTRRDRWAILGRALLQESEKYLLLEVTDAWSGKGFGFWPRWIV
jgi:hypothetical protein